MPETADPEPAEPEPTRHVRNATPLSDEEFSSRAEQYLEEVVARVEELQEGREDVEVDHAVSHVAGRGKN